MKISMRLITLAVLALTMALFTSSAFGQTSTTGSIEGEVVDATGAVVPGVTITVTSPNLISPQTAISNDEGRYRLPNLPPGRYNVVVEAGKGFARYEQANVEVNLGRNSSVKVELQLESVGAKVDITDTSGASVDVTNNTSGTNISTDQFSNFPTQRTVQSLYTIAPTVARSGLRDSSGRDRDPSVAGSSGPENNYILDGVTTSDPAFGGSGANLPFEFVQEVEIKTGAYGAEYGKATGGIFNVITKSGGNEITGDAFAYISTQGMVRSTKNFPFTGSAPNGFSEIDAGFDIGGPIIKDKLWFFGAFNPQRRKNFFFTQTFRDEVENQVTTPFYAGKITWGINKNNVMTLSTFGDFTKQEGFLFGFSGFGADPQSFRGRTETGGHNYAARLNSNITPTWIGEFSFGLHLQRANTIPEQGTGVKLISENFAIRRPGNTIGAVVQTAIPFIANSAGADGVTRLTNFGPIAYVPNGGTLERNFVRQGFGLFSTQDRNRWEFAARLQNVFGKHTLKYGFEYTENIYDIATLSTGPTQTFANPTGFPLPAGVGTDVLTVNGSRVTNLWLVCTTRTIGGAATIVCPSAAGTARAALIAAGAGFPGGAVTATLTQAEVNNNPFLIFNAARVRDFELVANTSTKTEGFYIQDDFRIHRDVQINFGMRWDYQQAYGNNGHYLSLNDFVHNAQPRVGVIWDFTGKGKGKLYLNFARFLETPIPLDVNVRAGSDTSQIDKNFNVSLPGAPTGSIATPLSGFAALNLGHARTPVDFDLKPQTVNEVAMGVEYEIVKDLALSARGIYRTQGTVIEDGSFDDGNTYFIFNPGESETERLACANPAIGCFGRGRRYYRAVEFSATKRFSNNYQFIASYVFSSLIGNYEGLFRNDNGQSDPNITSLFDLVSLLGNSYGRLPNDRPHQVKFDGSYQTPFKLFLSTSFRAQSGIPFTALIPHPIYGNNEGFRDPRGTTIVPSNADLPFGNAGKTNAIGTNRTPTTWNVDFGAYYPIQFGERRQLRLQLDWFNVFNNQNAIRLDETFSINSGVAGVAPVPNPFFGTGTIFQFPSAIRLGVKFQF
jgi:outer membrane receptor protein involved in Fe transport